MPPIYKKKSNALKDEGQTRSSLKQKKKSGFLNTIEIKRNGQLIPEKRDTKTPDTTAEERKKVSRLMIANSVGGNIELFREKISKKTTIKSPKDMEDDESKPDQGIKK